ncbi:MAG: hypothetical protein ACRCYY_11470 [Trueperaceae bacterium]
MKRFNFLWALVGVLWLVTACQSGSSTGPLAAPSSLKAAAGSGEIDLSWQDNSTEEEGFNIYRRLADEEEFVFLSAVEEVDAETYTDSEVSSVDSYVYQVKAFEGDEEGKPSNSSAPVKPILAANQVTLIINRDGSGEGITTSSPEGIECKNSSGGACSLDVPVGETLTLTANPDEERLSLFAGFSGGCESTTATCEVVMDGFKEVTATFAEARPGLTVQLTGDAGAGRVFDITTDGGPYINCGSTFADCTEESYWAAGNTVVLYAELTSPDSIFVGWEGCTKVSSGRGLENGRCEFTIAERTVISAEFVKQGDPPTVNLTATPNVVLPAGTDVTLNWEVDSQGSTELELSDNTGKTYTVSQDLEGSFKVPAVKAATTFTLEASNLFGSATDTASVALDGAGPAITEFDASEADNAIIAETEVTLSWDVQNADRVTLNGAAVSGTSQKVTPSTTTKYTLVASKAGFADATAELTLEVGAAPIITFSASPTSITAGSTASLTWTITNNPTANSIRLSGGEFGSGQTAGTPPKTVEPTTTTTYALNASNKFGAAASQTRTVTVTPAPPAATTITAFSARPNPSPNPGGGITFSWTLSGGAPTSLVINPGNISVLAETDGQYTLTSGPLATTTYTLTASNSSNASPATRQVTVTVSEPVEPVTITAFTVSPDPSPSPSAAITFSWTLSGDDPTSLVLNPGNIVLAATARSYELSPGPSTTTTYTLTASNSSNTTPATEQATVTVTPVPPPAPVIDDFSISSDNPLTAPGNIVIFNWALSGGAPTSLVITPGDINVLAETDNSYTLDIGPSVTTTYTLTATNVTGTSTDTVDVIVNSLQAPVISSFSAPGEPEDTTYAVGSSIALKWTVQNEPTELYLDGEEVEPTAQSKTVRLDTKGEKTFTLEARNSNPTPATAPRKIMVGEEPEIGEIVVTPNATMPGAYDWTWTPTGDGTLTYTLTLDGETISIEPTPGATPGTMTYTIVPPADLSSPYLLTVSNEYGPAAGMSGTGSDEVQVSEFQP